MLPSKVNPKHMDNRTEYLMLPYNSPIRKAMRGVEAQLGQLYFDQNARSESGHGLLEGVMAVVGAIGGVIILGPGGLVAGAAFGAAVGTVADLSVSMRLMTGKEWKLAQKVYGSSLPPYANLMLTDLAGASGRQFTIPGSGLAIAGSVIFPPLMAWLVADPKVFNGKILVNLAKSMDRDFDTYMQPPAYPVAGQVLIHELAHAWQINYKSTLGYLCNGLDAQARQTLGENVYRANPGQQFRTYGIEQQAAIVDTWYARCVQLGSWDSRRDPAFRYIDKNIRPGSPDADSAFTGIQDLPGQDLATDVMGQPLTTPFPAAALLNQPAASPSPLNQTNLARKFRK